MIYAVTVYCGLGPKLGLVVRKRLASLGIESLEARWSSSSKNISEVKGYSDWDCNGFFPLVTPALSGSEEAVILERTSQFYVRVGLVVVRKYSESCTGTQVTNGAPSGLSLGGIPEGYSDCTPGGIRGNGEELDVS